MSLHFLLLALLLSSLLLSVSSQSVSVDISISTDSVSHSHSAHSASETEFDLDSASSSCPCPDGCSSPPSRPGRESLFYYQVNEDTLNLWRKFPWDSMSILVLYGKLNNLRAVLSANNRGLYCMSRKYGVRLLSSSFPETDPENRYGVTSPSWISKEVNEQINFVKQFNLDGVQVDFEMPVSDPTSPEGRGLNQFFQEFHTKLHSQMPSSVLAAAWRYDPVHSARQNYDYPTLAKYSDLIIVMSYDLWNDEPGLAASNTPISSIKRGLNNWFTIAPNIRSKLLVGLAWYGFDFPCDPSTDRKATQCGVVGGWEGLNRPISEIESRLSSATRPKVIDSTSQTANFNYYSSETQSVHQVWYDDSETLKRKAGLVKSMKLGGIAIWTLDYLDLNNPQQVKSIWVDLVNEIGGKGIQANSASNTAKPQVKVSNPTRRPSRK